MPQSTSSGIKRKLYFVNGTGGLSFNLALDHLNTAYGSSYGANFVWGTNVFVMCHDASLNENGGYGNLYFPPGVLDIEVPKNATYTYYMPFVILVVSGMSKGQGTTGIYKVTPEQEPYAKEADIPLQVETANPDVTYEGTAVRYLLSGPLNVYQGGSYIHISAPTAASLSTVGQIISPGVPSRYTRWTSNSTDFTQTGNSTLSSVYCVMPLFTNAQAHAASLCSISFPADDTLYPDYAHGIYNNVGANGDFESATYPENRMYRWRNDDGDETTATFDDTFTGMGPDEWKRIVFPVGLMANTYTAYTGTKIPSSSWGRIAPTAYTLVYKEASATDWIEVTSTSEIKASPASPKYTHRTEILCTDKDDITLIWYDNNPDTVGGVSTSLLPMVFTEGNTGLIGEIGKAYVDGSDYRMAPEFEFYFAINSTLSTPGTEYVLGLLQGNWDDYITQTDRNNAVGLTTTSFVSLLITEGSTSITTSSSVTISDTNQVPTLGSTSISSESSAVIKVPGISAYDTFITASTLPITGTDSHKIEPALNGTWTIVQGSDFYSSTIGLLPLEYT